MDGFSELEVLLVKQCCQIAPALPLERGAWDFCFQAAKETVVKCYDPGKNPLAVFSYAFPREIGAKEKVLTGYTIYDRQVLKDGTRVETRCVYKIHEGRSELLLEGYTKHDANGRFLEWGTYCDGRKIARKVEPVTEIELKYRDLLHSEKGFDMSTAVPKQEIKIFRKN